MEGQSPLNVEILILIIEILERTYIEYLHKPLSKCVSCGVPPVDSGIVVVPLRFSSWQHSNTIYQEMARLKLF